MNYKVHYLRARPEAELARIRRLGIKPRTACGCVDRRSTSASHADVTCTPCIKAIEQFPRLYPDDRD